MYDVNDPRSALNKTAAPARPVTAFGASEYARFYAEPPQEQGPEGRTWYARGQNFITSVTLPARGSLKGRVISEALTGGGKVTAVKRTIQSAPAENGARTILNFQQVGEQRYFDAAGFAGKAVGLAP